MNSLHNGASDVLIAFLDKSGYEFPRDIECLWKSNLTGKIAVVTGGGTGIGKAIAASLATCGARVAIASRNRAHLDAAANEFQSKGLARIARDYECPVEARNAAGRGRSR